MCISIADANFNCFVWLLTYARVEYGRVVSMCPDRQQMMSCCCCHSKQKITFSRPKQKARLNTFSESTNTTFLVKPWRNGGFPYLNKRLCQVLRAWNSSSSWAWNSPDWRKVFFSCFSVGNVVRRGNLWKVLDKNLSWSTETSKEAEEIDV